MRNSSPIVALMAALLLAGGHAQQQSQPVPDAPQPQKKVAPKADSTTDKTDAKPAPPKDDNPFPEDASKAAAKAGTSPPNSDKDNPQEPAGTDNPFPEAVSRDAAKAAGNDPNPTPPAKRDLPPGVSSSRSSSSDESEPDAPIQAIDPTRARKDAEVGGFYLKTGDYQGALLRFKDAAASDPTNVDAIFGLAETERMLKKNSEAVRDYQLYLDIVPNGPKSKQALKALKTLGSGS